jgi:DNA-binding HxlR family transcriptional regulator
VRSYSQSCPIAKTLDIVGDRWNLLIVRELLIYGRCRYTDLRAGLPGIATNLLADRLRQLEQAGVIVREDPSPPVSTAVFALTERGAALEPVLRELALWGAPLMIDLAEGEFRDHWLPLIAGTYLADHEPQRPAIEIQLNPQTEPAILATRGAAVEVRAGVSEQPVLTIAGPATAVAGVLTGQLTLDRAREAGLTCTGDLAALARIRGPEQDGAAAPSSNQREV